MIKTFNKIWLYFLITLVPLIFYPFTINGQAVGLRKIRELALFSFAIMICSCLQKNIWLRLFIIWCVVNWWINLFPNVSYMGLVNILSAFLLYIGIGYLLKNKVLNIDIILKIICLTVIFQFIWMIMQKFGYDPAFGRKELTGWSGNTGVLGIFFATTSFLLLNYFKIRKWPIFFFLMILPILWLRNFTMVLCFAAGGLFYCINKYSKKMIWILCIILALGVFTLVKTPNLDRLNIWVTLIKENLRPFVGNGINSFSLLKIVDKTGTPWGNEAHNEYLQMYLEVGIIGLILFIVFVFSRMIFYIRNKFTNKQLAMASCLVAYLTAGISWFPMHLAQISFYAVIIFACLDYSYQIQEEL